MDAHVELVDHARDAAAASEVLRAAWTPPCLHYSADYLAWQLSFPGATLPRLALAVSNGRPVGCIGVTPRTFMHDGATIAAYVLSFVAVDPSMRGRGLAARLYETIRQGLSDDVPVIAFAQPGTTGERVLLGAFKDSSHHVLEECRAVGYAQAGTSKSENGYIAERIRPDDCRVFTNDVSPTLWNAPSADQLLHYARDPRERVFFVIRQVNSEPVAAAMAVATELATGSGQQIVAMIENLSMLEPSPRVLQAALGAAAQFFGSPSVIAPNLSFVSTEVTRNARGRSLPSVFNCHVFGWSRQLVPAATNLEII